MEFKNSDILSTLQFEKEDIEKVIRVAKSMEVYGTKKETSDILAGKILATLFYEPSTRTRLSFETAMLRLGGKVISVPVMECSSLTKGETLYDTGKIVANYADIIAIRHPKIGSADELAAGANVPVINAGDGPGQHPTQALLDVYTIQKEQGKIDGLKIAMVGDLKNGRTVHSLCYILSHYNVEFIFVSPTELRMPEEVKNHLAEKNIPFRETPTLEDTIHGGVDVLYCTRIQSERFNDISEYQRLKGIFILDNRKLELGKKTMTILHPLPRVDEIDKSVDDNDNAAYFRQAGNGVTVRMALLAMLLGKVD